VTSTFDGFTSRWITPRACAVRERVEHVEEDAAELFPVERAR
jgi:hypothetical protein